VKPVERVQRWCAVAAAVVAGAFAPPAVNDEFPRVPRGIELVYPQDHGAHPQYRTEWWYVTGQGATPEGRVFGVQFTIFRVALATQERANGRPNQVFAGHLAVADVAGEQFLVAERMRRDGSPLARASESDLDVVLEDWSIVRRADGVLVIAASDAASGVDVALELEPTKPLVLHGERGWSNKGGDDNASAYASFTRLALTGSVGVGGERHTIAGRAWFDQEFGSSVLGDGVVGWDWFGLHLDDGRDLMCFVLRRADGTFDPASAATLVAADGSVTTLASDAFTLERSGAWKSAASGATYPNRWRITSAVQNLDIELVPRLADCELSTRGSTGVTYWEGPVQILGSTTGSGYAELTGYAGSMAGRL
jgi:predicted secreted hydrolase